MILALMWLLFLIICPVVTVFGLILFANFGTTRKDKIIARTVGIVALAVTVGPVMTSVAILPWWIVGSHDVQEYYIWQYMLVCSLFYLLPALLLSIANKLEDQSQN